jgi:hypothetical protein
LTPQEGTLNFLNVDCDGTLTVTSGTGTLKRITGDGVMTCASADGIHTSCTTKLTLRKAV